MTPFESDIAAQAATLDLLAAHYAATGADALDAARALATGASSVVIVGMGSSRSAALPAVTTIGACLPADVREAGELLHYGMGAIRPDALVVLVSQSGRSVETLAVAERLRAAGHPRIVAVTNDPASPMASMADVVLPILAGDEATVSTKTWVTTFAVLGLLSRSLVDENRTRHDVRCMPSWLGRTSPTTRPWASPAALLW
jgi:glucosamine--fructose-6-phosphate aminotransferase (isomerizing)